MNIPLALFLGLCAGAGVVGAVLIPRRWTFGVTCEVFRDKSLDDVLRSLTSGSLDHIHLNGTWIPYAIVIVTVSGGPRQGALQSEFRRASGERLVLDWPIPSKPTRYPRLGLFQLPSDVVSVVTRVLSDQPIRFGEKS